MFKCNKGNDEIKGDERMTDELKTLKDFEIFELNFKWKTRSMKEYHDGIRETIDIDELRQEMIKWAKALDKKRKEHYSSDYRWTNGDCSGFEFEGVYWEEWEEASDIEGAIKILKKVFNLTEEDLK